MKNELLKQRLDEVEDVTGSGTAMVSLYISAGTNLSSERQRMSQEKSEAANIKSDQNRKNVEKAISRVNDVLKRYKETPENGMVLFVGVTEDGTEEFIFDDLDEPLEYSDYTCDNKFHTEPLRERIAPDHSIGLLIVERGGCAIGELRGTRIVTHYDEESNVMGKHNAGGQCLTPETTVYESIDQFEELNQRFESGQITSIEQAGDYTTSLSDVSVGDTILGWSEETGVVETEVLNKWNSEKKVYRVELNSQNTPLRASGDHIVFILDEQNEVSEKPVSELEVGDFVTGICKNISSPDSKKYGVCGVHITEVVETCQTEKMIDIETGRHNFFANGLLVHNSAERFDRLIEEQRDNYFDSIRQKLQELFINENNIATVDGFVIGGTNITVDNFVSDGYLPQPLQEARIGGTYSIDIASSESLERLVDKARSEIDHVAEQEEREAMNKFFESLHDKADTHATYGEEQVQKALDYGAVDTLLVSENMEREKILEYEDLVENQGGELLIISDDFSEGEQFWNGFNGLGALLRYQIE